MDARPYVVVAEIRNGVPGAPPFDIRLVDAFSADEACKQVLVETWGRYGHEQSYIGIVCLAPHTLRSVQAAVDITRELSLMRMAPVGAIA